MTLDSAIFSTFETFDHSAEATECGSHIVSEVRKYRSVLLRDEDLSNESLDAYFKRCGLLVIKADEAISTYPYSEVPDCWRQLYMDASLLQVIAGLRRYDPARHRKPLRSELLELVRILDMANIVTGYFEAGRDFSLSMLMDQVQNLLRESRPAKAIAPSLAVSEDRPKKRVKTNTYRESRALEQALLPDIKAIKRFQSEHAPGMDELADYKEPFIVTGGIMHWPAIADPAKRWKDVEYWLRIAGEGRIVPVEIGSSYTAEGWTQKMMDFTEFLTQTGWMAEPSHEQPVPADAAEKPTLYLAQHDLFQQFPELLQDIIKPDYVFAHPEAPEHFPEYKPPSAGYTVNAWLGPAGTYSPAHTDPYYNCYAQVVGQKHIWVAPPSCARFLAGEELTISSEDEEESLHNAASQQYMGNTAQVDVFAVSAGTATRKRDQAFQQQVLPYARQAILEEGDLLFMPPKWWHAIKALERSFSVSMWF